MKLPILIICSLFLSFFVSFIFIYFLAKMTSKPYKSRKDENEFGLDGAEYDCKVKNINIKSKLASVYKIPQEKEKY